MRALLARVPEPLADLDHVPATAATVLERVRYLHERYDLERCRVLLLGDHDATSLAFAVLGVQTRELAVVDVDQRQLGFLAGHGVDTRFADLRVGLPAPLRGALRPRPDRSAVLARGRRPVRGARARGAERASARRLLVAYGYPEGSPALGLKVQTELSALELVYEAVLPDFNAYDGAQAIGSRAALYVLRPTKRSRKIAARRGEPPRRGALHARPPGGRGGRDRAAGARRARRRSGRAVLRRGLARQARASVDRAARRAAAGRRRSTSTSRRTSSTASTRRRSRRSAQRVVIVAHNRTEGLRTAAEQARLRELVAPRYEVVQLARSWRGQRVHPRRAARRRATPRDERRGLPRGDLDLDRQRAPAARPSPPARRA